WLIHDRRRVAGDYNRSLDFPTQLAAVFIDRDQIRRGIILIDRQDHLVVNENGRRAKTVEHVEWTKRKFPTLLAVCVVREHSEILEENVNVRAVSHRARRRWTIHVLQTTGMRARHFTLPEDLSRLPIESDHIQLVLVVPSDEDPIVRQHWR